MLVWYCFVIVLFLPPMLALGSIPFRISQFGKPDIQAPRPQADQLTGAGARIVNAQKNAWEALILFTATLFIAVSNNVPLESMATACLIFVGARIAHALFYISGFGLMRFLSFGVGIAAIISIVFRSLS